MLRTKMTSIPDQEVVAKLAELDLIVAELEAATTRIATVERRNVRTDIICHPCTK
jgi:hypothetical protein